MTAIGNPAFVLRPYQVEACDRACAELEDIRSTLIVAFTGAGKTEIFCELIRRFAPHGRAMMLAHTRELIFQTAERIRKRTGFDVDIEMGAMRADSHIFRRTQVVVSTVQSQDSGETARMTRFDPMQFGLLVLDEAHHCTSPQYRRVIDHYLQNPKLKVVGVTATPDRADEEALGQTFETVAFEYNIENGINDGYLVPIRQEFVPIVGLDFSHIKTVAGELSQGELTDELERKANLHGFADAIHRIAEDRRTLVFTQSVKQAEDLSEILNRHAPGSTDWICGATDHQERKEKLAAFHDGRLSRMVNCSVLLEGYDHPDIEVVVCAKPTKSRSRYAQMIGRGTRPLPGVIDGLDQAESRREAIEASAKPSLLVVDFVGNSGTHKLVHTTDILGGNYTDEVVERAERLIAAAPMETAEALAEAQRQVDEERRQREEAMRLAQEERRRRREKVTGKAEFRRLVVDPFALFDIRPARERGWDTGKRLSEKQADILRKHCGVDPESMSYVEGKQLLNEQFRRWKNNLVTFKMAAQLKKRGHDPTNMSMDEGRRLMDEIARREGWSKR